ncbi:RagB/SusD family nutrient uptake outer membrane protein [Chryseolinea lacunae]|uniref:RagB/SusD family nutrient uptake outer membrane protein n=1 Tax=Chryseolinea lacunae TaxID=2801331 RepID=A0ABS1KXE6_9BACT|nr:RagB/SusD family nutrient uptake outer membrane protein [Chryseolinea lacunae]MBL0743362.1 RagB/SusD family nutrient uptake outer membrane protein [Chryseolinea lacunae]
MKTNKLSILTFCTVMIGGLFSCQTDLLDTVPETLYPSAIVFDTPSRVEQQVNGMYDAVKDGDFLGSRYLIYSDIRGEEFINRLTNGVTGLQTWNHTLVESTNEVNNTWRAAYQAVNQINVFLKGLDDNAAKFVPPVFPAAFATATVTQYKAEARFLRGLTYYYLLQLYAKPYVNNLGGNDGVPLRLKAEQDFTGNDLARSSVKDVYAQILSDLDFAEQNLAAPAPATTFTYRANKYAAIAFKTRVYLAMQEWDKVITEANKIVSATAPFAAPGNVYKLSDSFAGAFSPTASTLESIFSFPFTALDAPGTQNQLGYYYLPASAGVTKTELGNGEYYLNRKGILGDTATLSVVDDRRKLTVKVLILNAAKVKVDSAYYLTKYSTASPYTDNSPIMRYAEVLLNLAEARIRSTNSVDAQALDLFNAVRTRSKGIAYTAGSFADADAMITALLKERRAEFLGEGLRSSDCLRLNLPIPGKGTVSAVNPTDPNYIWPMPTSELNVNTLLTHN